MRIPVAAFALLLAATLQSQACDKCHSRAHTCAPCPQPACEWREVERTVLVPEWTTEKRKVEHIEYKRETSERKVTVNEWVQKNEQVTREVTTWEKHEKSRKEKYTVHKPVWKDVTDTWVVKVPHWETRKGTRMVKKPVWKDTKESYVVLVPSTETHKEKVTVWRSVPVEKSYTVCEDHGHWEEHKVPVCAPAPCRTACGVCNACNPCPQAFCVQRVWVPKIVQREAKCTVHECKAFEETREVEVVVCKEEKHTRTVKVCEWKEEKESYEYKECVMKEEKRSCKRKVCEMVAEQAERTVTWFECVPKEKKVTETVCRWECVPVKRTVKETVCVPVTVTKMVDVPVCRMVEKKVKEKVAVPHCAPACAPAASCSTPCYAPSNSCSAGGLLEALLSPLSLSGRHGRSCSCNHHDHGHHHDHGSHDHDHTSLPIIGGSFLAADDDQEPFYLPGERALLTLLFD